jgi:hypothetical protein
VIASRFYGRLLVLASKGSLRDVVPRVRVLQLAAGLLVSSSRENRTVIELFVAGLRD